MVDVNRLFGRSNPMCAVIGQVSNCPSVTKCLEMFCSLEIATKIVLCSIYDTVALYHYLC